MFNENVQAFNNIYTIFLVNKKTNHIFLIFYVNFISMDLKDYLKIIKMIKIIKISEIGKSRWSISPKFGHWVLMR